MTDILPELKPDLLPCPFCGDEPVIRDEESFESRGRDVSINCYSCDIALGQHCYGDRQLRQSKKDAYNLTIAAWQTRTPPASDAEAVDLAALIHDIFKNTNIPQGYISAEYLKEIISYLASRSLIKVKS